MPDKNHIQSVAAEMSDAELEKRLAELGKTAPRITPDHISRKIKEIHFFTAAQGITGNLHARQEAGDTQMAVSYPETLSRLTFCVLTLENDFTVTGQSACASPENFDATIGQNLAFEDAKRQIWKLEGYLLREQLHFREKIRAANNVPDTDCRIPTHNHLPARGKMV